MAAQVNVHEAKTHLSRLLARVQAGEEIIIAKAGEPIARLTRIGGDRGPRSPGSAKGRIKILPAFDEPLPEFLLDAFER
jgi:prevent-host-death family protein